MKHTHYILLQEEYLSEVAYNTRDFYEVTGKNSNLSPNGIKTGGKTSSYEYQPAVYSSVVDFHQLAQTWLRS